MKTIEQLLELTKNPYYVLRPEEQAVLDDFLARKRAEHSTSSVKQKEKNSDESTPVIVRNIVQKTIPRVPLAPEPTESLS